MRPNIEVCLVTVEVINNRTEQVIKLLRETNATWKIILLARLQTQNA